MTNFEYYKDKILEITKTNYGFAFIDNKPVSCRYMRCSDCEFNNFNCVCGVERTKWLYEEHIEQPKLNKKERQFCELVETGWIVRNSDGKLTLFGNKPAKNYTSCWGGQYYHHINSSFFTKYINCNFSFITWEDEEPWSVEELLKLEVEE